MALPRGSTHVYFRGDTIGVPLLELLIETNAIARIEYVSKYGKVKRIRRPVIILWAAHAAEQLGEEARRLGGTHLLKEMAKDARRKRRKRKGR